MAETATTPVANGSGAADRVSKLFTGHTFQGYFAGEGKNEAGYEYLAITNRRTDGTEREERFSFVKYDDATEKTRIYRAIEEVRRGTKVTVRTSFEVLPTRAGGHWLKVSATDMRALD